MIQLIKDLKLKYNLKIASLNNEGKELNEHRVKKFKLLEFVDFFISSSLVHFRKPDVDIWKIGLDIAQAKPSEVLYIDDRQMFVEVARNLGINGIVHENYESTKTKFEKFGLSL